MNFGSRLRKLDHDYARQVAFFGFAENATGLQGNWSNPGERKEMPSHDYLFLFLAAAVVSVFGFCSVVVWVSAPYRERQARDRMALFKTLVENPSENAREVLAILRAEDARRVHRKAHEERRGYILGGSILIAVGVGTSAMLMGKTDHTAWTGGLIPLLIGLVLLGAGLSMKSHTTES